MIGYHITRRANLPMIRLEGLKPNIPTDMADLKGIYFFKSWSDVENGLVNWFGDRIDEWEETHHEDYDEIILKVALDEKECIETAPYEWTCLNAIEPHRILEVLEA